uniref:EGF-like domain-containing protein n=1 Tax=Rhabditophanes sp. KR3021 TaxID=114890 RepID=A0AC35TQZ5_9BILA
MIKIIWSYIFILPFLVVQAHISLIFPPPRFPPFDYLDNQKTIGPCGIPKPKRPVFTTMVTETSYDIFWTLPKLHEGGFKISLLNQRGQMHEQLTMNEQSGYMGVNNATQRSYKITFTHTCKNCTLLIEKNQHDMKDSGRFVSCSDVNIIKQSEENADNMDEIRCSGHGTFNGVSCTCDALYSGNKCEIKSLCTRHSECKNGGKCIGMKSNPADKACFCAFGFFGNHCERTFLPTNTDAPCFNFYYPVAPDKQRYMGYGLFNPPCYQKHKFSDNDYVYYRSINEEIEVILDFKTTSWVSLGWRPKVLDGSCRLFPDLDGDVYNTAGYLQSALETPLHPMDCSDIMFGAVRDGLTRIADMYTRDRSTPMPDSFFDGEYSFSAAYGIEVADLNRTVIMFRRNVREQEPSDTALFGPLHVIWAKGFDVPENDTESEEFYESDSLKYHGPTNRGVAEIEFISKANMPNVGKLFFGAPEESTQTTGPKQGGVMTSSRDSFPDATEEITTKIVHSNQTTTGGDVDEKIAFLNSTASEEVLLNEDFITDAPIIRTTSIYLSTTTTKEEVIEINGKNITNNNEEVEKANMPDITSIMTLSITPLTTKVPIIKKDRSTPEIGEEGFDMENTTEILSKTSSTEKTSPTTTTSTTTTTISIINANPTTTANSIMNKSNNINTRQFKIGDESQIGTTTLPEEGLPPSINPATFVIKSNQSLMTTPQTSDSTKDIQITITVDSNEDDLTDHNFSEDSKAKTTTLFDDMTTIKQNTDITTSSIVMTTTIPTTTPSLTIPRKETSVWLAPEVIKKETAGSSMDLSESSSKSRESDVFVADDVPSSSCFAIFYSFNLLLPFFVFTFFN